MDRMTRLGMMLRLYRAVTGQSLRDCAREMGVHYATLNRAERTDGGMTAESFLKLLTWMLDESPKSHVDTP